MPRSFKSWSVNSGRTLVSMSFSANLCAYSDMPRFLSQSAICCMAVTAIPSGPDRVFHHGNKEFTPISPQYHASQYGYGLAPNGKSALLEQRIWEDDVNV